MGASILVHWPGATEEEEEGHPGFFNDDKAWAGWLANVMDDDEAIAVLKRLGLTDLLSHTTDGLDPDEIRWTTPDALELAAQVLKCLVEESSPEVQPLLRVYATDANGIDSLPQEFARDLGDVAEIARYARAAGAATVTLGYYW
ncbi:MAG TPA: hypothetical protein VGJ66_15135 [Pyrinomonadaceae bacterium]|jgi:hypothetical protein